MRYIQNILTDQQKVVLALIDVHTFCDLDTDLDFGRSEIIRFFAECPYGTDFDESMKFINENVCLEIRFVIRMTLGMYFDHISRDEIIDSVRNIHLIPEMFSWVTDFENIVKSMGYLRHNLLGRGSTR